MSWKSLVVALLVAAAAPLAANASSELARRVESLRALSGLEARIQRPPAKRRAAVCAGDAWRVRAGHDPARTERAVRDAALRFGVDQSLVRSVIRHESGWDPAAVSHAGAIGLMQLMPATARSLGTVCPFDPRENVMAGTRYLRELRDRFGDWSCAIAAYNAGPTRVERGTLPGETRRYVARVTHTWRGRARACDTGWRRAAVRGRGR